MYGHDSNPAERPYLPCAHPHCPNSGDWLVEDREGTGRYVCETHIGWGADPEEFPKLV